MGIIDVQDCAMAHYHALMKPEAAGRRFILVNGTYWMTDIAGWLKKYNAQGWKVPQKVMGPCLMKCLACCVGEAKLAVQEWDKCYVYDNSPLKECLGMTEFKEIPAAMCELAEWCIENGYAKKK